MSKCVIIYSGDNMATKKDQKIKKENLFLKVILVINIVFLLFISIVLSIILVKMDDSTSNKEELSDFDFKVDNVDYVTTNGKVWSNQIFAPFVDIVAWVSGDYSVNGALDLGKVMNEIDIQYFNLGFITASHNQLITNNTIDWCFGGYDVLSEGQENSQYDGIKKVIDDVRNNGGDITISIGGLNEGNFFQVTSDVEILTNTYLDIVDGFNLSRLDLDIEGGSLAPYVDHTSNALAIKKLQDLTNVEIVLTLPVMPEGLIDSGLQTLRAYINAGVDIKAVNIMGMCYGSSYYNEYDSGTIKAIDNTMLQIKSEYNNVGKSLSDSEAYNKLAITTSIGFEGSSHPIFDTSMTELVIDHCSNKKLNFVSYWSLNRDSMTQSNSGIYSKYEHALICLKY